jgi:hypothetical protein
MHYRFGISHSWWCTYEHLNALCKKDASKLKKAFLKKRRNLDVFIKSNLSRETADKIKDELRSIVASKGSPDAAKKLDAILQKTCAQDLHENGENYIEFSL